MKKNFNADFVIYGLEKKVFLPTDVMQMLYDPCFHNHVSLKGNLKDHCTYEWTPNPFNKIPIAIRRQIVTALTSNPELYRLEADLRDEFYTRICCALHILIEKFESETDITGTPETTNSFECMFDYITPSTLIKEFNNWHKWGLPVSLKERELLHLCLRKFLTDNELNEHHLSKVIAEKKAALLKKIKKEKAKLSRLKKRMSMLDKKSDEVSKALSCKIYHELWLPSDLQYESLAKQLALAETYTILTADYPVMEERLR